VPRAPRLRFAPSPTGYLHVGGARAVLFNWLFARQSGGEFLLRIEDTDTERNQPELVEDILDSIRWLGLGWDGEPVHQSDNRARHLEVAEQLVAGGHAFWSAWQPPDAKKGEPPARRADDRDAGLGPGEGRALRFRVPDTGATAFTDLIRGEVSVEHTDIEDFVLVRANGTPMFLLANAVDDADMAITHVLRGEEHVNGTPKYLLIQAAMGVERPAFAHLPILVDEQRKKLSKRKHAVAVSDFRARGILPEAMVNHLALLGWGPKDGIEVRPIEEVVALFRLEDVNSAPAFFDVKKLEAINGDWLRGLPVDDFLSRVEPFLTSPDRSRPVLRELAAEVQTRVRTLAEAEAYVDFLWLDEPVIDEAAWEKAMVKDERSGPMLDATIAAWEACPLEVEALKEAMEAAALAVGYINAEGGPQLGKAQAPVRVALTGRAVGPPLFESVVALGRVRTLERLRQARTALARDARASLG
jgi:glutamyl-tRNA synthetase